MIFLYIYFLKSGKSLRRSNKSKFSIAGSPTSLYSKEARRPIVGLSPGPRLNGSDFAGVLMIKSTLVGFGIEPQ